MRIAKLIIYSAFLVTTLSVARVQAFDMPVQGKWWHDEHMVSALNLTSEQRNQIEEVFSRHRKEFLRLSTVLKGRYATLEKYLESQGGQEVDRQRLSEMVDGVQGARSELEKSRLMMLIEVRKVLSGEQTVMLNQMRQEMMRHMEQMGTGSGGPMGGMGMHNR